MKEKEPRWKRIDELTENEQQDLEKVCKETQGFSLYGNRARMAVMLPLNLADMVSKYAKSHNISVGQALIQILEERNEVDKD